MGDEPDHGMTRRTANGLLLGGLAGGLVAAATLGRAHAQKAQGSAMMTGKIDTHQHYLPKVYLDAIGTGYLASLSPTGTAPQWSLDKALAMMEANGIAEGILSVSGGLYGIADPAKLLRLCNDYGSDLRAKNPGRFGLFASLPLPDIDASLKEIVYSLDTLKADGFIIFTNYDGKYLGDPLFAPLLEEFNRRKAVVLIHPTEPPYKLSGLPSAGVLEFVFDTTRTATSLMLSGALKKYSNIKFILSHAGGTLPFLTQRVAGAVMMSPGLAGRIGNTDELLRAFWYDIALSTNPATMAALLLVADPGKITFGTDFPWAPTPIIQANTATLAQASLNDNLRAAIYRDNAARLLGRS